MAEDSMASGRATHEQSQQAVSAVPVGIPDAVRRLLADIARIENDWDLREVIYDNCGKDLFDYFDWRNCMDLADAYGRGEEDAYHDEIMRAYYPDAPEPCQKGQTHEV